MEIFLGVIHKSIAFATQLILHIFSPQITLQSTRMNLSNAAALILASAISAGAFVPAPMRGDIARSFVAERSLFVPSNLKMSDGAVMDAETVTNDGEKFE